MVETPIYFSGVLCSCCYFMGATVRVCSATESPAEDFQSELFTKGNTVFERSPVCLVWKCLILSVPCVQWLSACGQNGSSSGSHRRKYVGEKGLVWEWVGPGEKFSLRKWSAACESWRTTDVAHSTGKTNKCKGRCIPGSYDFARGLLLKVPEPLALGHCPAALSLSVSVASRLFGVGFFFFTPSLPASGDLPFSPSGKMLREEPERPQSCFGRYDPDRHLCGVMALLF